MLMSVLRDGFKKVVGKFDELKGENMYLREVNTELELYSREAFGANKVLYDTIVSVKADIATFNIK